MKTKIKTIKFWDEASAKNTLIANLGILYSYTNVENFNIYYFQANLTRLIKLSELHGLKLNGPVTRAFDDILRIQNNEMGMIKKSRDKILQMIIHL